MQTPDAETDAVDRKDVRALKIAIWVGVAIGAGHGIPRYGLFSIGNLALIGLGVIVSVGFYAAWIALRPARPLTPAK